MISPTRGSEYSVAWNYVSRMSRNNDLVVLYGSSGDHMGDFHELENYLKMKPIVNVEFIQVKPTRFVNALNTLNRKGILQYSFYFAYRFWQNSVYKVAKSVVQSQHIDLIHFLNPIGYREPGKLWKLNLPYIWGPIGGVNNIPAKLFPALQIRDKIKFLFRFVVNFSQIRWNIRLRKALKKTDLLLTATTENQQKFESIHNKESIYLAENAIHQIFNFRNLEFDENEKLHFTWIGSIDGRKALIILLEALLLVDKRSKISIDIIGDGPLKEDLMDFARKHRIEDCLNWHGNIPRSQVFEILGKSRLNIITSLSEGNPTTIWESMSLGVPTLTLDHCGMHDTICSNCGIKLNIESYRQVVSALASELDRLSANPSELKRLALGAYSCSKTFSWDLREEMFQQYYDIAINNWKALKN
jgi:glycosyltransferase involved in cell wall biosynthesis